MDLSFLEDIKNISNFSSESDISKYFPGSLDDGEIVMIVAYTAIVVISLFGNTIVCHVIFKNRRMHTVTNLFIANLAISDLLVTVLNVPFNIARHLIDDWPFGKLICHLMNLSLMVSVYVSTFTLTAIALDRHRVLLYPLSPRMTKPIAYIWLAVIWFVSICLSLPFGIYNEVAKVDMIVHNSLRCRSAYPEPSDVWEQYITVATITLQYIIPLVIIAIAYGRIVHKLWIRTHLGAVTEDQQISQTRAKKKSIKMLITVVVVFAMCWMPLNLYHLLTDLHPDIKKFNYNVHAFFVCHWVAISSTCYNPFVYCWLNEVFRSEVKARFSCLFSKALRVHPNHEGDGVMSCSESGTVRRWNTPMVSTTRSTTIGSLRLNSGRKSEPTFLEKEEIQRMLHDPVRSSDNSVTLAMWPHLNKNGYSDDDDNDDDGKGIFEKLNVNGTVLTQF